MAGKTLVAVFSASGLTKKVGEEIARIAGGDFFELHHIEGAAKAVDLELTDEELTYLEELYVPHPLAGVMAQNKRTDASKKHVWTTGAQKIIGGEK